jgi:hypothetical protein
MNLGSRTLMGIAVGVGLLIAVPDGASAEDEPQGGCGGAGQFIALMAREEGRAFGEFSSDLAALGLRDDIAHGLHAAFCPRDA